MNMSKLMKCSLKNIALTLAGFLLILAEIQAQNRVDELRKILLDADGRVMVASHRKECFVEICHTIRFSTDVDLNVLRS